MVGALFSPPDPRDLRITRKPAAASERGPVAVDRATPLTTPGSGLLGPPSASIPLTPDVSQDDGSFGGVYQLTRHALSPLRD